MAAPAVASLALETSLIVREYPAVDGRTGHDAYIRPELFPPIPASATSAFTDAASIFEQVNPRLFGIAYRMLGSVIEAEDIAQEVWMRWHTYDRSSVRDVPAFLATIATRLAINAAQSARARRETAGGPWLPDPVDTRADPELAVERTEALEHAVLLLLQKLSPTERAAYILRQAFDYPYERIAALIRQTPESVRQQVSRARKHLTGPKRTAVSSDEQRRLLDAFVTAARTGDLTALEQLFAADVARGQTWCA